MIVENFSRRSLWRFNFSGWVRLSFNKGTAVKVLAEILIKCSSKYDRAVKEIET